MLGVVLFFTCPKCDAVSVVPRDVRERYCVHCRDWMDDPTGLATITEVPDEDNGGAERSSQ